MVRVLFTDFTEYYETVNSTENIHKQGESGGFVTTETGYYWLLWVDLSQISETSELVASGDFLGIPFVTVEGPVTFEVEKGELKLSDKIYPVWAFMTDILDLFYDVNTGLLLKARYNYDIGVLFTTKMELVDSTILTTKAGTLFTFDILVISVSIIALVSIWYRKQGKLDKNIRALQQNRIRRN